MKGKKRKEEKRQLNKEGKDTQQVENKKHNTENEKTKIQDY